MELETTPTPVGSRCAHCGAGLREGAPWCTLCLAKPAPDPAPAPVPHRPSAAAGLDPLTAPLSDLLPSVPAPAAPSWPCASCHAANDLTSPSCAACGAGFLEAVRQDEPPLLVLPLVGDLSRLSKGQRLGLAAGCVLAVVLLVLLLGVL